ncbi:GNAT family N-acetyltransferase [Paenibacillus cremeus]|uniref:GNAT family N-acetyltransferase n=1 Tax=Paenibacillus cremeus TaxID=2163881 RepID=A0A559KEJ4_9BACL|nr:GNAT family N-acetyltransferase [Paenibacillus cremeus]TVY10545.1 GNAT family N-acetyltransferase [Paenibacillus cremeus]
MNPILMDFPTEFTTERLIIRMPKLGDGLAVNQAIRASIEELKPWLPFAQSVPSVEESEAWIRDSAAKWITRENLMLLVFLKETGQLVASSGLHRMNWRVPKFEIGYWIDTRFSGQGYMTEAVQGITAFAFDELHARRVEIRCDPNNVKSRAIPERLGFILEGILRNDAVSADGSQLRDTCVFAKIK